MKLDNLIKLCEEAKLKGCTEIRFYYCTDVEAAYLDVVLISNLWPAYEIIPETAELFLEINEGE
jgi:hypothetical protein